MNCFKGGRHAHVGVVKDCKPPLGVVGKGRCCCQLVLRLQKGKEVD